MRQSLIRHMWVVLSAYSIGFYASCINRFRAVGLENLPSRGGVLLAANHISAHDTVFLPGVVVRKFPTQMVWAPAKEELFRNPILAPLIVSWGAFPVKRRRDVKALKKLQALLQTEKVMLFPEGTRSRDGKLGKGNRGVGKLIYDTHPVVIPVALSGLNHWKFPGYGQHGKVVFGAPIDFTDLYRLENNKRTHLLIVERLMDTIARLLP